MTSRWMPTLVLVASSLFVTAAGAQDDGDRPRSLAYRLAELRRSWSSDDTAPEAPPAAPPQTTATPSTDNRGYLAIAADSMRNSLPRVNPRNLLGESEQTAAEATSDTRPAQAGYASGATTGRSRMRPGSRSGRYEPAGDVAHNLGVAPQSAAAAAMGPAPAGPVGIVPMPGSQRVGSNLAGPPASGSSATTSPAAATPAAARVAANDDRLQAERRRQQAANQLKQELIGSGADSRDTRGFGFSEAPNVSPQTPTTGGYATAAEAARQFASPAAAPQTKPLGPATVGITPQQAESFAALAAIEIADATAATPSDSPFVMSSESNDARRAFQSQDISPSDQSSAHANSAQSDMAAASKTIVAASPAVLASQELPLLATRVVGPRQIMVGHEASYVVRLDNRGRAAADEVVTRISIPQWANVVRSNATRGNIEKVGAGLDWKIDRVAGESQQSLELVLVPTAPKAIELGVVAHHASLGTTTLVEVQEPKLEMVVSGPDEVFYGRKQTYRLTVSNPGTGPATNINLAVIPPGASTPGGNYRIATLAPGETRSVDFDMIARQAGDIAVRAVAEADGSLSTTAEQAIFCRKAQLELDWRGPEQKYSGTAATYYFRVHNSGTAAAERTTLAIALPPGFELKSASDGAQHDAPGRRVAWSVGAVEPGGERFFELAGIVNEPGENNFELVASTESGEANDRKLAVTNVIAVADLKLLVADPKGPVPVGREAVYEITIANRGRSAAANVQVVGLFSEGIEPVSVEGATASIANGRVGFAELPTIQPGAETKFRIKAKGLVAGTHLFRAEVLCSELDIKLAAEESTQFYVDQNPTMDDAQGPDLSLGSRYTPSW